MTAYILIPNEYYEIHDYDILNYYFIYNNYNCILFIYLELSKHLKDTAVNL